MNNRPFPTQLSYLVQYPASELYRLPVDGRFHAKEQGWKQYEERQPGCLKAAFDGLAYAISNIENTHLTVKFVKELHKIVMTNVKDLKEGTIPGKIRTSKEIVGFYMPPHVITQAGLKDLFDYMHDQTIYEKMQGSWIGPAADEKFADQSMLRRTAKSIDPDRSLCHETIKFNYMTNTELAKKHFALTQDNDFNHYLAPHSDKVKDDLKQAIQKYNQDIKTTTNEDEKLNIIVDLVWTCDHIHPFMDGNIRTFAVLLLNRLLLQNGFPPVTLMDPNKFDCHSKKELVAEVKIGMKNSLALIEGEKKLFGFNTDSMEREDHAKLAEFTGLFIKVLGYENARLEELEARHFIAKRKEEILTKWGKHHSHNIFKSVSFNKDAAPPEIKAEWKLIKSAEKHGEYGVIAQKIIANMPISTKPTKSIVK